MTARAIAAPASLMQFAMLGLLVASAGSVRQVPGDHATIVDAVHVAEVDDVIAVAEGEWIGVSDGAVLEGMKGVTLRSIDGPLLTAITCAGNLADRTVPPNDPNAGHWALNLVPVFYANTNPADVTVAMIANTYSNMSLAGFTVHGCGYLGVPAGSGATFDVNYGAQNGGGIAVLFGLLHVEDCIFHSNSAKNGGAIYARSSYVTLERVIFHGNSALTAGGAIYLQPAYPECNEAFAFSGCAVVANRLLIRANEASDSGGGVYVSRTSLTLTNAVLTANKAGSTAGGILLKAGLHTLERVVNEANEAGVSKPNVFCDTSGAPTTVFGSDGTCFCLDSCTSSGNPVQLGFILREDPQTGDISTSFDDIATKTINFGLGNFFDDSKTPFYFGGDERVFTIGFRRPVHMVKITVSGLDVPAYEEYVKIFDGPWPMIGTGLPNHNVVPPPGELSSMTGVSGFSVTSNTAEVSIRLEHSNDQKWFSVGTGTITIEPLDCSAFGNTRTGCNSHGECRPVQSWVKPSECVCDDGFIGADCLNKAVVISSSLRQSETDYLNLQLAINDLPDGDTATILRPQVLSGAGNRRISVPPKSLTLKGVDPLRTILDCEGADRGFLVHHAQNSRANVSALTLEALSIANCIAPRSVVRQAQPFAWPYPIVAEKADFDGKGGALFAASPVHVALNDVVVTGSEAERPQGAAIFLSKLQRAAVLQDVLVYDSFAGGGLMLSNVAADMIRTFLFNNDDSASANDRDLMCEGGSSSVSYSGTLLDNELESFNCHCGADCTRPLTTAISVTTATVLNRTVVIQGSGLAIGADSTGTTLTLSDSGGAWTTACTQRFVRPHLVLCDASGPAFPSGAATLAVERHDGKSVHVPVSSTSGIEAIILGSNITTENGGTGVIAIRLRSEPEYPVKVPISDGIDELGNKVAIAAYDTAWFTTQDWNVWKHIAVRGVDDTIVRPQVAFVVELGPTESADIVYGGEWPAEVQNAPVPVGLVKLLFANAPFSCPQISMVLNSSATGCECGPGYTAIEDGIDGAFVCAACVTGYYKFERGNGPCTTCPGDVAKAVGTTVDVSVSVEDCVCRPGYFATGTTRGMTLECEECPAGAYCGDWGYRVMDMGVNPGYWRADMMSPYVLACTSADHCIGADNVSTDPLCLNSTYGYQCFGCRENFGRRNDVCEECPSGGSTQGMLVLWCVGALLVPVLLILATKPPAGDDVFKQYPCTVALIKILISHLQMRIIFNDLFPHWNPASQSAYDGIGALASIYFAKFGSTECLLSAQTSTDRFYTKFLISMGLPPFIAILPVGVVFFVYFIRSPFKFHSPPHPQAAGVWEWQETSQRMKAWCINMVITLVIICYPGTIHSAIEVLVCDLDDSGSGESYLRAEKTIICSDDSRLGYVIIACAALVIYGLGVPCLLYKIGVHRIRHNLSNMRLRRRFGLLFMGYHSKCLYWDSYVMLRTAVLMSLSAIENTVVRIAMAALLLQVALCVHMFKSPYESNWALASRLEAFSLVSTIFVFMLTLLQAGIDVAQAELGLEMIIFVVNATAIICILAVVFCQMYVDFSHIPRTNPAGRIFMRSSWGGPNLVSITPGSSGFSASSTMANKKGAMKKQFKLMAASRKFGPDSLPGAVPEVEPPADERQEPAHEKEEESYTVAEEIMYMAKEKELNAQLEALSEELQLVKKRETMAAIMSKMARSSVRPPKASPTASMLEMRTSITASGGFQFGKPSEIKSASDVPPSMPGTRESKAVQTDIAVRMIAATDTEEPSGAMSEGEVSSLLADVTRLIEHEGLEAAASRIQACVRGRQTRETMEEGKNGKRNPQPPDSLPPKASARKLDFMKFYEKSDANDNSNSKDDDGEAAEKDTLNEVAVDDGSEERDKVSDELMKKLQTRGKDGFGDAMTFVAARDAITAQHSNMRHLKKAIRSVRTGHKDWWEETVDHVDVQSKLGSAAIGSIDYPHEALAEINALE